MVHYNILSKQGNVQNLTMRNIAQPLFHSIDTEEIFSLVLRHFGTKVE